MEHKMIFIIPACMFGTFCFINLYNLRKTYEKAEGDFMKCIPHEILIGMYGIASGIFFLVSK